MKVYLVRHGQTEYNTLHLHQPEDTGLSKLGVEQAKILAKRLSTIPIDIIYASPMKRAKETAEIINKSLNRKIIYSNLLRERKWPSEFLGKRADDPEIIRINKIRNPHDDDPSWHYSDEENFIEFKKRVQEFLDILLNIKKKNVLVITHGATIKMMILLMMGNEFSPETFYKLVTFYKSSPFFTLRNAGINLCEKDKKGVWSIQIYDNHSHLG